MKPQNQRQRNALLAVSALRERQQRGQCYPPISLLSLGILQDLLVDDDAGGEGLTISQLSERRDVEQGNIRHALSVLPAALVAHAPAAGIGIDCRLSSSDSRAHVYAIEHRSVCPCCLGTGSAGEQEQSR